MVPAIVASGLVQDSGPSLAAKGYAIGLLFTDESKILQDDISAIEPQ